MGTIAKILGLLLLATVCFGQMSHRRLMIASSAISTEFTPSSIGNLIVAFDSLAATNFVNTNGNAASHGDQIWQWLDYSGNALHLTNQNYHGIDTGNGTIQYQTNGGGADNSLGCLYLVTSAWNLHTASDSQWHSNRSTVIMVGKVHNTAEWLAAWQLGDSGTWAMWPGTARFGFNGGSWVATGNNEIAAVNYVWTIIIDGASSSLRTNGVVLATGNVGPSGVATPIHLAGLWDGGNYYWAKCSISRLWIYRGLLTAGELSMAEQACLRDYLFIP